MSTVRDRQTVTPALVSGDSDLGGLAVAVVAGEVTGVSFGQRSAAIAATALARRLCSVDSAKSLCESVDAAGDDVDLAEEVLEKLRQFAAGDDVDLTPIPLSLGHLTPFQRRVVRTCRAIKRGALLSYGEVAAKAGSAGAARAVGQVMRTNRTPLIVPCHRVVAAGGKLGGFSAPQGLAMKRRLLELESDRLFT
ncbi:methylated-DNA--[protein]-cysteine S-methyltransferase [Lacipirellula limnantheis]|uniref:methylated-DNA--[protein]-cysteine S-methyltransferase n=1 Tax=Lacipirellula limnantheis TaxID=2528024 RepID=A0A517TWM5_9BACT|nr:methylated-DNA--[protein]-cysteine S-methyltransferase [Lacipirellula limnantheis]QDT72774.1 Methylated-DNA--protein-cysteine methyltransferase [Lacipirellula limnantheis]